MAINTFRSSATLTGRFNVNAVADPFPLKYWLVGVASFCDGGGPKYAISLLYSNFLHLHSKYINYHRQDRLQANPKGMYLRLKSNLQTAAAG